VTHACNPSYSEGREREDKQFEVGLGKNVRPSSKNKSKDAGGMTQVLRVPAQQVQSPEFKP
jgi:hypothetical protein